MTLVVGYDGTEGARAALHEAAGLAGALGDDLHLVFSFEAPRLGGELRDLDEAIHERGVAVLRAAVAALPDGCPRRPRSGSSPRPTGCWRPPTRATPA